MNFTPSVTALSRPESAVVGTAVLGKAVTGLGVGVLGVDAPDVELPDVVVPDVVLPDGVPPDVELPDVVVPDGVLPEGVPPDVVVPDGVLPDVVLPDGVLPDGVLPDVVVPDEDVLGAGGVLTVKTTPIVEGVTVLPLSVTVIVLVYVPEAKPLGFSVTVTVLGVDEAVPLAGAAESHAALEETV